MTNIFVGNISYQTTQDDLYAAFSAYGAVDRVSVVTDRDSGQSRGFAFVEMPQDTEARTAIDQLNGAELNGRAMNVNEARPRANDGARSDRSRNGYRGGARGGSRGGSRW
jgi:RNA recognition motif-containing protein